MELRGPLIHLEVGCFKEVEYMYCQNLDNSLSLGYKKIKL